MNPKLIYYIKEPEEIKGYEYVRGTLEQTITALDMDHFGDLVLAQYGPDVFLINLEKLGDKDD